MLRFTLALLALLPLSASAYEVQFAYNEPGTSEVVVQSMLKSGLIETCGQGGCTCEYTDPTMNVKFSNPVNRISTQHEALTCAIPIAPRPFGKVQIKQGDYDLTPAINISTTLSLEQVLHGLDSNRANRIYKYSCQRTFFEGEGVSPNAVSCVSGQRLGLISANYSFYLFDNQYDGNRGEKFTSSYFPGICGRPEAEFARFSCQSSVPDIRFGLYDRPAGIFHVKVYLSKAPEGTNLTRSYGFAAYPDAHGDCAPGLQRARAYVARPASITEGSINGYNPPSNFLNLGDGSLNDLVVDVAQPANFQVIRSPNTVRCADMTGSCAGAQFGGMETVQNVTYEPMMPNVCVIPKALFAGRVIGKKK